MALARLGRTLALVSTMAVSLVACGGGGGGGGGSFPLPVGGTPAPAAAPVFTNFTEGSVLKFIFARIHGCTGLECDVSYTLQHPFGL